MDKSSFEVSLKDHHWLATFLDPHYKRFEFLPICTGEKLYFRTRMLSGVAKWIVERKEKSL